MFTANTVRLLLIFTLTSLATSASASPGNRTYLLSHRDPSGYIWGPPGKLLYLTKDVEKGATLTSDCLEPDEATARVIPLGSIADPLKAVGRVAAYNLRKGSILNENDLMRDSGENPSGKPLFIFVSPGFQRRFAELAKERGLTEDVLAQKLVEENLDARSKSNVTERGLLRNTGDVPSGRPLLIFLSPRYEKLLGELLGNVKEEQTWKCWHKILWRRNLMPYPIRV